MKIIKNTIPIIKVKNITSAVERFQKLSFMAQIPHPLDSHNRRKK
jgi:hypothetical protein